MTSEELKIYSDPRRFNLILTIGEGRLQGWFVPYGVSDAAPVEGIGCSWIPEPHRTLSQIENGIYDNPLLLEDYETRILIETPRIMLFPEGAPEALIETAMMRFYETQPEDIFTHPMCGATMAFALCPGLKPFLGRTFAGVLPRHRLDPLCRYFRRDTGSQGMTRVYVDLDSPWVHLIAFSGDKLLHASTHRVSAASDAAYFVFALWQQLGLTMDNGMLQVSGNVAMRRELMPLLRRHINYVALSLLPSMEGADTIPTPVRLVFNN